MAQITVYMNYTIFFQSEADYNTAIALTGGSNLLALAPRAAATLFGIPFPYPSGNMSTIPKGIYFSVPFTPGAMINFPNASGINVDDTVDSQLIPGQAGNPASIFPAGPDGLHVWSGNIIRSQGAGISSDPPPTAIAQRKWLLGFEWAELQIEGSGTSTSPFVSRDASRTIDGKGFVIRGDSYNFINVTTNLLRPALVEPTTWERFYIRVRRLTSGVNVGFWRCHGTVSNACGVGLKLTSVGTIRLFSINNVSTQTDRGVVFTPTINQWYRVDVLLKYATGGGTDGRVKIYIDGTEVFSFTDALSESMNGAPNHASSDIGRWEGANDEVEIDLDDWRGASLPSNINATTLFVDVPNAGIDWLLGSHIRRHIVDSASLVNWTPNAFGNMNQGDNPINQQTSELSSVTSGAQADGLTDALLQSQPDTIFNVLGAAAAVIGSTSSNAGATDGQLGYRKAGAAATLAVINEQIAFTQLTVGYVPSGMILPDEISPWSVVYQKSADANNAIIRAVVSDVEYLGVWGPEDDPIIDLPVSRLTFLHNAPYFNTAWGYVGSEPAAPVFAVGGTYIGNGTTNEITLPGPCHFLWIRNTNGGGSGTVVWFSPSIGPVLTNNRNVIPNLQVFSTFAGVFKFRVTGNAQVLNQNTHTYQYIAFCDPGMRYNLCGVFNHDSASSTPKINPLILSAFLAEAGFVQPNNINSIVAGTERTVYKGPGISANSARPLDATAGLANYMNFASGILNTLANAHFTIANNVYSLWRTADSGVGGCTNVMIQLVQYTGDGAGSKVVPLTPTSGRFPLFVMVVPDAASNGFWRDPSHAGANSSFITNNGLSVTAITAVGTDQITVGASLNSLGVVYSVFAICGAVGSMANGTYFPTYCVPTSGPWVPPSPLTGDINVTGDGGFILNGTTPLLLLLDISGIYTLVPGKINDTLQDRQTGQTNVEVPILPVAKTGYIGG